MLKGYFNQVRKVSKLNLNLAKSPETVASFCEKNNYCEAVSQKNKDEKMYIYEKLQYNTFIEDKDFSIVLPLQISSFTNSKRGKLITWRGTNTNERQNFFLSITKTILKSSYISTQQGLCSQLITWQGVPKKILIYLLPCKKFTILHLLFGQSV